MQDLFIEFLPPWVETGLQPAFYDRESGTVLQQTARMYAKINELVKAVNGMDKIIKEYVDYIDNYFKNLDVQEEVNNKLDDMAESGDLATTIAQFLAVSPVFGYVTISDMSSATNLQSGCIARVIGNTDASDGDGAYYIVRAKEPGESADGVIKVAIGDDLIADRIVDGNLEALKDEIEDELDDIRAEIHEDYYIVLGDSYGAGYGSTTPFTTYLQSYLNLDNDHFTASSLSGVGFCQRSYSKIFIEMLQDIASGFSADKKDKITKIVVETGINDKDFTYNEIYSAVVAFYNYAIATFPNAKVYICGCGRSCNPNRNSSIVGKVIPAFYEARRVGVNYIVNSEYTLHDYTLYQADAWHPTEEGQKRIAECIAQGTQTGTFSVSYERDDEIADLLDLSNVIQTIGSKTIRTTCKNDVATLILDDNVYFETKSDNRPTLNGSAILLGTIRNEGVGNRCLNICQTFGMIPITGYVHGTKGGVEGNYELHGKIYAYTDGGQYKIFFRPSISYYITENQITNVTAGTIDLFTFTLDSNRC